MLAGTMRELRYKEVISISDGSRYGYVGDLDIDLETGRIRAVIVPGQARFFGLMGRREDVVIPWEDIHRFGEDIILVDGPVRPRMPGREKRLW